MADDTDGVGAKRKRDCELTLTCPPSKKPEAKKGPEGSHTEVMTGSGVMSGDGDMIEVDEATAHACYTQDASEPADGEDNDKMTTSGMSESWSSSVLMDSCTSLPDERASSQGGSREEPRHDGSAPKMRTKYRGKKGRPEEGPRSRPNYFIGFKVSNPEIHHRLTKIQEAMVGHEPLLYRALTDVATAHVTLLVAHLDTDQDVDRAKDALDECVLRLREEGIGTQFELTFSGLGHFSKQVVFAKMDQTEEYSRLVSVARVVRATCARAGICMPDVRPFNPHLTIAKTSKAVHRRGRHFARKIDVASYSGHEDAYLGRQVVAGLQLLSMNAKDQHRYYWCVKQVLLDPLPETPVEGTDHSLCCFPRRPEKLHSPDSPSSKSSKEECSNKEGETLITQEEGPVTDERGSVKADEGSSPSSKSESSPEKRSDREGRGSSLFPYIISCCAMAVVVLLLGARFRRF